MRYLNSFILIGAVLLILSIIGFATHSAAISEPGQPLNNYASMEYLGAGVLMILNGIVSIRLMDESEPVHAAEPADAKNSDNKRTSRHS
jgi:hypothetical protein